MKISTPITLSLYVAMATAAGETPGYLEAQLVSKAKEFPKCALKCWAEHANKLGCAANNMWCINNKHTFQSMEKLFDCTPKPCNYSNSDSSHDRLYINPIQNWITAYTSSTSTTGQAKSIEVFEKALTDDGITVDPKARGSKDDKSSKSDSSSDSSSGSSSGSDKGDDSRKNAGSAVTYSMPFGAAVMLVALTL